MQLQLVSPRSSRYPPLALGVLFPQALSPPVVSPLGLSPRGLSLYISRAFYLHRGRCFPHAPPLSPLHLACPLSRPTLLSPIFLPLHSLLFPFSQSSLRRLPSPRALPPSDPSLPRPRAPDPPAPLSFPLSGLTASSSTASPFPSVPFTSNLTYFPLGASSPTHSISLAIPAARLCPPRSASVWLFLVFPPGPFPLAPILFPLSRAIVFSLPPIAPMLHPDPSFLPRSCSRPFPYPLRSLPAVARSNVWATSCRISFRPYPPNPTQTARPRMSDAGPRWRR